MADLIGEEQIDWETFQVTDPGAPEFEGQPAAAAEAPVDTEAPALEDTAQEDDGRPRDPETGQFISAEELERRAAEVETPQEERLFAGKYRTVEELERAVIESQSLLGRQGSEVGELRQQMQELTETLARPRPEPIGDIDVLMADGMLSAAERTAQAQDWDAHNRVLREWEQTDPDQAGLYRMGKQAQYEAHLARQQAAQLEQAQQQQTYGSAMETAWARLRSEIPDLDSLAPAMTEEATEAARVAGKPVYTPLIESGDPDQIYYAFRTLALTARNRSPAALQQQAADMARTAAVETQRAKAEAMVASATGTAPDPPQPKSYDDELLDRFKAEDERRDGWNIGGGGN